MQTKKLHLNISRDVSGCKIYRALLASDTFLDFQIIFTIIFIVKITNKHFA